MGRVGREEYVFIIYGVAWHPGSDHPDVRREYAVLLIQEADPSRPVGQSCLVFHDLSTESKHVQEG